MDSKNIDLIDAKITQISAIISLVDPDSENAALWAVQDLLDQTKEAAEALWNQGIQATKSAPECTHLQ